MARRNNRHSPVRYGYLCVNRHALIPPHSSVCIARALCPRKSAPVAYLCLCFFHRGIRIPNLRQICRPWTSIQISEHRIDAERADTTIKDGELQTACQQSCPANAIVFGNLNDPNSRVAKLQAEVRNYALVGELNTRPRTTYLAAVRNVNPELGE